MAAEYQEWRRFARQFIEEVINHAYLEAVRMCMNRLETVSAERKLSPIMSARWQWYQRLDEQSRKYVEALVTEVADAALFQCLVVLDNKVAGTAVPGQTSEYVLMIKVYASPEAKLQSHETLSVRLNPTGRPVGELHDLFVELLDELRKGAST